MDELIDILTPEGKPTGKTSKVSLNVPYITLVEPPSLAIETVDVSFDLRIHASNHATETQFIKDSRGRKIEVEKDQSQKSLIECLLKNDLDRVFIALHGVGGEDGKVQALLDLMNIPYTGSGHASSAMAMNKLKAKQIWMTKNILTPKFTELSINSNWNEVFNELNGDLFVKPVLEGSSLGMSYVTDVAQLTQAYKKAYEHGCSVIAEQTIKGREFTVALLNDIALSPVELTTDHTFYDYEAKYTDSTTHYYCPVDLSEEKIKKLQNITLEAAKELDCYGWGRADFIQDDLTGDFYLLEINTVPGMTDHSLVPMAAKQAGLSFDDLVLEILMQACSNDRDKC